MPPRTKPHQEVNGDPPTDTTSRGHNWFTSSFGNFMAALAFGATLPISAPLAAVVAHHQGEQVLRVAAAIIAFFKVDPDSVMYCPLLLSPLPR